VSTRVAAVLKRLASTTWCRRRNRRHLQRMELSGRSP
jgi:hypothetical protein